MAENRDCNRIQRKIVTTDVELEMEKIEVRGFFNFYFCFHFPRWLKYFKSLWKRVV